MQQFEENAEVYTSDGHKAGRIERVVIDPRTKKVSHIVVKKGFLFTTDKVIPVDRIQRSDEARVELTVNRDSLEEFPDFESTHYISVDNRDNPEFPGSIAWYYPYPGTAWWYPYTFYPRSPYIFSTERNIPENTIPLEEGAKVISANGKHVGDVERVITEPKENRATHLLVSHGLISKERKLIPTLWIEKVSEDEVRLSVESKFIEDLPDYPE